MPETVGGWAVFILGAVCVGGCGGTSPPGGAPNDAGSRRESGGNTGNDGAAHACIPESVAGFTPTFNPPPGPHTSQCTASQLNELIATCFATDPMSGPCNQWLMTPSNAGCLSCWGWETPTTSSTWPPFVLAESNGGVELFFNLGGCIDLADPSQVDCAKANEAKLQCELAACVGSCGLPANGDTTANLGCYKAADESVCANYVKGLSVCEPADAAMNPAAFCYQAQDLEEPLLEYLTLACGSALDSGVAPTDGSPD
jgi:hypothetical protein